MNSITSETIVAAINDFADKTALDINMICHYLEYTKDYAISCLTADDVPDKACDMFSRLHDLYNANHLYIARHAKPSYTLTSICACPTTIDFGTSFAHTGIYYQGRVQAKVTDVKSWAHKFTFLHGTLKMDFYVVEGLYPWIFVPVKKTDMRFCLRVYIDGKTRTFVVLKPTNLGIACSSKNTGVSTFAKHYDIIALAVEHMQKFCNQEDSCLQTCSGTPVDLKIDTHYPGTHKSPIEHIRKAHIRTYKNGKQTFVREAVVGART